MTVKLQWATPEIDKQIMFMARVSNVLGQNSEKSRLLFYCHEQGHISPFQMVNVCFEITSTRDITRQIMRHWSMNFHELDVQEFSQRYALVDDLGDPEFRECRMQDPKNRQSSLYCQDEFLLEQWACSQERVWNECKAEYDWAISEGIAKEQARALLPEGLTPSRIYLNGNMRNWIGYLRQRLHVSTQSEHRLIAQGILITLRELAPITMSAFFPEEQ